MANRHHQKEKPEVERSSFSTSQNDKAMKGVDMILEDMGPNGDRQAPKAGHLKAEFAKRGHTLTECENGGGFWLALCNSPDWPKHLTTIAEAEALLARMAGRAGI
jgi:hypothetical protein